MGELLNGNIYVPANEKRLKAARDVYQTAARMRPLLLDIFKNGGLLDQWLLGSDLQDKDCYSSEQLLAGHRVERAHAARRENIAYACAEVGYFRHYPNFATDVDTTTALFSGGIREIALASCLHLDLPSVPAITFDPIKLPPLGNFLFAGVIENYRHSPLEPLKTSEHYDDVTMPLLVWKIDPYPSCWSDAQGTPESRLPFSQGDMVIKTSETAIIQHTARTVVFAQSDSADFRSALYEQYGVS